VVEDLNLCGCRGQKRFAYRALHAALAKKAPCLVVNPAYTSQECLSCGFISKSNRQGVKFHCRGCGRQGHADIVGARNIVRRSYDTEITCDTEVSVVKKLLLRRLSEKRARHVDPSTVLALGSSSRKLTVEGTPDGEHCIASNAKFVLEL
jgi:predicted RNA-binding Zn-ribbon protein involved in translation (DUF1610 family)